MPSRKEKEFHVAVDGDIVLCLPNFKSLLPKKRRTLNEEADLDGLPVRIVASSEALCAASPVFRTLLNCGMAESTELKATGRTEIHLTAENDPGCLLSILHAIHGEPDTVPWNHVFWSHYSFNKILEITYIVDRWDVGEAMCDQASVWLDRFEKWDAPQVPQELDESFLPWLWVAWTFKHKSLFERLVSVAQMQSTQRIDEHNPYDIPIPNRLVAAIENRRVLLVSRVREFFLALIDCVRAGTIELTPLTRLGTTSLSHGDSASRLLQAMHLGYLQLEGERMGVLGKPSPEATGYHGVSVQGLANYIAKMDKIEDWAIGLRVPAVHSERPSSSQTNRIWVTVTDDTVVEKQRERSPLTLGRWFKGLPPWMEQAESLPLNKFFGKMLRDIRHENGGCLTLEQIK